MLGRLAEKFRTDLAIDLGTANTLISVAGEGLVLDEPSVVAVEEGTSRILSGGCAVGHLAKQMQGRTPSSISVVRPLTEGAIADFELCEAMLRYFFLKTQRRGFSLKPRVVVAVPGCITQVQKRALYNSMHRAGARQVFLMGESKAAAMGVGLPIAEPVASMVCDIGGGTTEVAVMSLADLVASESIRTGGDCMDRAIVDYLQRHFSLRIGVTTAERLRIDIGSAYPLEEELTEEVSGVDCVSGLPRKASITSEEIRAAIGDPLSEIIGVIKATLDHCTPELASDLVDNGMVLCGGGSLLRGMDQFISEQTSVPARVSPDALSAVARGTLICVEHLDQWRGTLESSDDDI